MDIGEKLLGLVLSDVLKKQVERLRKLVKKLFRFIQWLLHFLKFRRNIDILVQILIHKGYNFLTGLFLDFLNKKYRILDFLVV